MRARRAVLAVAMAIVAGFGCGGGTNGGSTTPAVPMPAPTPAPEPPPVVDCDEVRREALLYWEQVQDFVDLWDQGSPDPFEIDMMDNFPEHLFGPDFAQRQVDVVARYADLIEEELGYPILAPGEVVPEPETLPEGWNDDTEAYFSLRWIGANELRPELKFENITGFYMNDSYYELFAFALHDERAFVFLEKYHETFAAENIEAHIVIHEAFHHFGFKHYGQGGPGVEMSLNLMGDKDERRDRGNLTNMLSALDLANLACIFPEP